MSEASLVSDVQCFGAARRHVRGEAQDDDIVVVAASIISSKRVPCSIATMGVKKQSLLKQAFPTYCLRLVSIRQDKEAWRVRNILNIPFEQYCLQRLVLMERKVPAG